MKMMMIITKRPVAEEVRSSGGNRNQQERQHRKILSEEEILHIVAVPWSGRLRSGSKVWRRRSNLQETEHQEEVLLNEQSRPYKNSQNGRTGISRRRTIFRKIRIRRQT
jgi:hypothetical protein